MEQQLAEATSFSECIAAAEETLTAHAPQLCRNTIILRDCVEQLSHDRTTYRAQEVAKRLGLSPRSLQRKFAEWIGVSPKFVIQRYRLHEAAARLSHANSPALTSLAAELGYTDQAHLSRDFRHLVGYSPGQHPNRTGNDFGLCDTSG